MTATVTEKNTKADILSAYNALVSKHEKLLTDIVVIGGQVAADHDWCEVFEETLAEIGIERQPVTIKATIATEVEVEIDALRAARLGYDVNRLTERDVKNLLHDYTEEEHYGDITDLVTERGSDLEVTQASIA